MKVYLAIASLLSDTRYICVINSPLRYTYIERNLIRTRAFYIPQSGNNLSSMTEVSRKTYKFAGAAIYYDLKESQLLTSLFRLSYIFFVSPSLSLY